LKKRKIKALQKFRRVFIQKLLYSIIAMFSLQDKLVGSTECKLDINRIYFIPVSCGFENDGMCGWTQDASDQFDWSKGTGNTTSVFTGPKWDRTYETGFG